MRKRKVLPVLLLILLFLPAVYFLGKNNISFLSAADFLDGSAAKEIEDSFSDSFLGKETLCRSVSAIKDTLGRNKKNGCFYGENGIIKDLPQADEETTLRNISALRRFAQNTNASCYFLLTPTAAAIKQRDLPSTALDFLFNQKLYIQNCNDALTSYFHIVNGYNVLFAHQEEYLYYRTDSHLTSLGCYYLYDACGKKMGYSARSMDYFSVWYPPFDFRGDLAESVPYAKVEPDLIGVFRYERHRRTFSLVLNSLSDPQRANLYDDRYLKSGDPLQIYLGPDCAASDILVSDTPFDGKLLIFTDGSCDPLFPLIAVHYRQLRVVDLRFADSTDLDKIDIDRFDQILFAFSVESLGYDRTISESLAE